MSAFPHALSPTGSLLFPPGMSDSAARQWTLVLVLTALFLSLVVLGQIVTRFGAAYWAAPREIAALLDSADSSLQENESFDRDVAKVPRLEDRIRLGHLLREIQRACDDLREDLNAVLANDTTCGRPSRSLASAPSPFDSVSSSSRLTTTARILWAAKRTRLEERLRRLDLLRMRFLVVHMGIITATATAAVEKAEKSAAASAFASASASASGSSPPRSGTSSAISSLPSSPRFRHRDPDKTAAIVAASLAAAAANGILPREDDPNDRFSYNPQAADSSIPPPPPPPPLPLPPDPPPLTPRTPKRQNPNLLLSPLGSPPGLPYDLLESIRRKPPLRRVSTLPRAFDPSSAEGNHRTGWMGVVQELQRSPLLHKRHTSIETSASR